MGNHDVGRAIEAGAIGFWFGNGGAPVTKERALAALDAIVPEHFRGSDAEFDDATSPEGPLGQLLAIAFGPYPAPGHEPDADGEGWYEGIERPFYERYDFC